MDATHDMEGIDDPPQYPGDDTRPTSKKEISGFYSYGFAAEVFVICGIGSFVPIALEQLSRERGFLLSDRTKPCKGSSIDLSKPSPDDRHSTLHPRSSKAEAGQCIITILGADVNTASFAMYTFSISVLIQALLIISMSAAADHGRSRKSFLLSFAFTGAVATMLFLAIVPEVYLLGALLAVIANTCFGASFVLLNSFLPILVRRKFLPNSKSCLIAWSALGGLGPYEAFATSYPRYSNMRRTGHPTIRSLCFDDQNDPVQQGPSILVNGHETNDESPSDESTQALLKPTPDHHESQSNLSKEKVSPALRLSTQISSYGIGIGYFAAVMVQTLGIIIVIVVQPLTKSTTLPLRLALFVVGLWWLVFTIPSALWLRPRPGPPLPSAAKQGQGRSWIGYSAYAWKSLWKTILRAGHLKDVMLFLAAWFLLSDSIATISGTAVLFAKTDLQMKPAALALISLTGTVVGVIGAFSWGKISRLLNLKPSQTIIACICLFEVIPLYGLLGFIPAIKRLGVFGLQQPWEMYPLGAIYGFVLGGLSSYCRSLFGELIPPGFEAAFYALYAITDKGSSVFGPAIVGAITDRYGEIRPAFVFLAILIFIPLPIMLLVDVDRGKREGAEMARMLADNQQQTQVIERDANIGPSADET